MVGIVLLLMLVALLVAWAMLLIYWLSKGSKEIKVLPFETAGGEEKYSGRALADLFLAEWRRIHFYHSPERGFFGIDSEQLPASSDRLAPRSDRISRDIGNVATAGVGQTRVSVG